MENKCETCKYAVQSGFLELCTLGGECEYQAKEENKNEI